MNIIRTLFATAAISTLPNLLIAQSLVCAFDTECIEGEACNETTFEMTVNLTTCPPELGPRGALAETVFGELGGEEIQSNCNGGSSNLKSYHLSGDGSSYLLSVIETAARLSVHMEGPLVINYQGSCIER